jgi:hypothetical protein
MAGQKISSLPPVSDLQSGDQIPLARSGSTYKISGDKFTSRAQMDSLSATADSKFALKASITSLSSTCDNKFALKNAAAGGDLQGTYPNPTVAKINGMNVSNSTPTAGQVLTWNGFASAWVASALPAQSFNLTGDVTSTGTTTTYNNVVPATKGGAGAVNGILKANGSGTVSAATAGTDYVTPAALGSYATVASLGSYATVASLGNYATVASLGNYATVASLGNYVASSSFTQSLASSGWQKLPGGLIIQWGSVAGSYATSTPTTFPISFPNACSVAGAMELPDNSTPSWFFITGKTNSGFSWNWNRNGGYTSSATLRWTAIGY